MAEPFGLLSAHQDPFIRTLVLVLTAQLLIWVPSEAAAKTTDTTHVLTPASLKRELWEFQTPNFDPAQTQALQPFQE